ALLVGEVGTDGLLAAGEGGGGGVEPAGRLPAWTTAASFSPTTATTNPIANAGCLPAPGKGRQRLLPAAAGATFALHSS
ncbi:MAG: hypothetical protein KDE59_03790, partial [Anaerolineales bacterium]|nr:hypothetical protein [Anaerolineales bacterium]